MPFEYENHLELNLSYNTESRQNLILNIIGVTLWENRVFAYAKTKAQISCAVTAQLISAFVFATQIATIPLLPKSENL